MKKLWFFIMLGSTALFSMSAGASGGYGGRGEWGEHHGHHGHHYGRPYYREEIRYYAPPRPYYREVIKYYPPRPRPYYRDEIRYYPQPLPPVRPQPYPYFPSRDSRSTSGLAGSAVGGAVGYQFGNGDPLAAGIGAAAGSFIGNGMDGR
ncbi:MAG: glycine zipper 2TM domain-containing protein [Methylovulum sp.]|uniref:glycine zipper 2TM domain-containing protein n=1 Tax=Methylovulum sp. TaxID=1916980 RepID=UPI0026285DE8|nr:glycine zipper 2TM domain-containing protein [Methylovulum sp.]MDD2724237.1 glycine zipper 2TM domain-containing protein [Methylovulum sp.]MDD5123030.1 glycine zipper 2TM domain-containing protein [Methylovulum sp.]